MLSINPILFILRISSVVDVAIRPLVFMTPALAKILSGPKSEYSGSSRQNLRSKQVEKYVSFLIIDSLTCLE